MERELKASHAFSERLPALAFSNQGQQAQPLKEWHFDGVPRFFSLQQIDHLALEKRPVHERKGAGQGQTLTSQQR